MEPVEVQSSEDETEVPPKRAKKASKRTAKGRPVRPPTGSWKTEDDIDHPPAARRFSPNRPEGFQLPNTDQNWSPADLFLLFFIMTTLGVIVANANSCAEHLKCI